MSKVQLKKWISEFPEGVFTSDGKVVYCQPCAKQVSCSEVFQLKQHSVIAKHQKNAESFERNKNRQPFMTDALGNTALDSFSEDLCNALIAANIPFKKLSNASLRSFLEKYCKREIPDESTLRKNYLKASYQQALNRIKTEIGTSYIWASVDETTDIMGRYVANLIVGKLESRGATRPYLFSVKMLQQTNHSTIARFVNDGLQALLDTGEKENRLLLLVTDAATYMKKAADVLSALYPKMIHVTCVCHALHRVSEQIRFSFPEINELISNTKKVFTKALARIALYKSVCENLPLPPEPILTRWGTWIKAALFYSENFKETKTVIEKLNPGDAVAIQSSVKAFNQADVMHKLAYIQSHFAIIPDAITRLETRGMPLAESLYVLFSVKAALQSVPGEIGQQVRDKFNYVLEKNPGIGQLVEISKVINGDRANMNMDFNMLASMKYAPIVSCDVERSFNVYKNLLTEKRTNITPEHLAMYMICNCEAEK